MIDYKNTLNLPETEFKMRGNLVKLEPSILHIWYKTDLYEMIRKAKKGKKIFFLHDGPPYANGRIHIGHSVNKILKDIIIKFKSLMGYDSPYIPGWDCHGLPIELKVEQMINKPGNKVCSSEEFRAICRKYVIEQVNCQKKDFIRLGVLADWKNAYLTMDFVIEANIIRTLSKIIANGHLYKGTKPVHWCIDCSSVLAEYEIEYQDIISPSIYVKFRGINSYNIANKFGIKNIDKDKYIYIVIWTTTPWTMPANSAISVNPDLCYQLVEANGLVIIVAKELIDSVMHRAGIYDWKVLGSTKGSNLELLIFSHPFMNFNVPIILSKNVTLEVGTGAVHIAPGHGPEDYNISKKYNLEIVNIVGPDGYYIQGQCNISVLNGLQVFDANNIIIDLLSSKDALLYVDKLQHSYPHCWRHKTPIIFRTTQQWFISMDKSGLRKKLLEEIKNVKWIPYWCKAHIENMVANRSDWCISRQRKWGVPMSFFVHNETLELHPNTLEIMEKVAKKVEEKGIQAWWDLNPKEIIGSDATLYHKVLDTLDVWFDSGSTHNTVVTNYKKDKIDMYLEGSDQHRGWFMSSLIISTAIKGKSPYKEVLTHGFVVDGNGRKMSKSLGNVISPQQIIEKLGSDIFRIWVASVNYADEMTISDEIIKRSIDYYRRIRNTARFLLANLNGFIPKLHSVNKEKMVILDRWAVGITKIAQEEIIDAYNSYNFHNVIQRIMLFCSVEMGAFYLEIIKDRKYTAKVDSIAHRSCQTAIYHIIMAFVRWIAPILSFTAHEIWNFIPGECGASVFTEEWYNDLFDLDCTHTMNNTYWKILFNVRSVVNKVIEQARADKYICNSLEASIVLYAKKSLANKLRELGNELCFALLTSAAVVDDYDNADTDENTILFSSNRYKGIIIALKKAKGKKCLRCWHYETDIGQCVDHPDICGRCIINVVGLGEKRKFV